MRVLVPIALCLATACASSSDSVSPEQRAALLQQSINDLGELVVIYLEAEPEQAEALAAVRSAWGTLNLLVEGYRANGTLDMADADRVLEGVYVAFAAAVAADEDLDDEGRRDRLLLARGLLSVARNALLALPQG